MGKFFITVGIILYIILMLWVIWVIYSRITARRILREGRRKKNFTFNYLSTRFSRLNTMKDVKLFVENPSSSGGRFVADIGLVFVNKGGIVLIDTIPGSGLIDIKEGGQWNRIFNNRYYPFDDPFKKSKEKARVMKMFLRNEGVENVPVNHIVLFSGKRVSFSKRLGGLITVNDLVPYIKDVNTDKYLTTKDIREVVRLIKQKSA